jgi:RNA polymerase sigma-70 factor (ECF subfamily)
VLLLSAVEELGTGEIALVMERSEAAVRGLLFRARERLRERLGTRLESRWDGRV